jgi:phosphate acetyltransferase
MQILFLLAFSTKAPAGTQALAFVFARAILSSKFNIGGKSRNPVMLKSLYIATTAPRSGKSLVVLGLMELLSRRVEKLGFFRPVIRKTETPDNDTELVRRRYKLKLPYESLHAMTHEEARACVKEGKSAELLERVFVRYKELERQCDFIVCEGTDLTGLAAALEFDFNAEIAKQIGAPVVTVTSGQNKSREEIVGLARLLRESSGGEGRTILATVINRVPADILGGVVQDLKRAWPFQDPVYALPEEETLGKPTVGEIVAALGARPLHGADLDLNRVARSYKIAAMQLSNFLGRLDDDSLVIAPGDRADVVLGSIAAFHSRNHPKVAGIILTGGLELSPEVNRLIEGMGQATLPIFSVDLDTYEAASRVSSVVATIGPDNPRKIAAALGVFENNVDLPQLEERIEVTRSTHVTPIMFEYELVERAKADKKRVVLPEGNDERILRATEILLQRDVVDITLLGSEEELRRTASALGLNIDGADIVDPSTSKWLDDYARTYHELRKHKGITEEQARDVLQDVSYFGTMMVRQGVADAMVSGAAHTTGHTIRPAFEFIRVRPERAIVSSVFFMCLEDRVLVYGDCAVNPDPNPEQLADIAIASAETARIFGVEPLVAMLSYSSGESGKGADVDKVREATRLARELRPDLKIEGPLQYDAACDPGVASKKMPDSEVAGRATVFVFPDLNTGNNTYKAVQRSANAVAIGPVLQGLRKPVNDLSRGCTIPDIVNTVAITAIQAQTIEG